VGEPAQQQQLQQLLLSHCFPQLVPVPVVLQALHHHHHHHHHHHQLLS